MHDAVSEACWQWAGQLSQGELQRLAFARVLHARPVAAVMDEPVGALSVDQGTRLVSKIQQAGIALLCTGQLDCPLRQLFQRVIVLSTDPEVSWTEL